MFFQFLWFHFWVIFYPHFGSCLTGLEGVRFIFDTFSIEKQEFPSRT